MIQTTLHPMPGIVIIELIKDTNSTLHLGDLKNGKNKQGKVIAVGNDLFTDFGATLRMSGYCKVGDVVSFLSYGEEYDILRINNKDIYAVKVQDLRAVLK